MHLLVLSAAEGTYVKREKLKLAEAMLPSENFAGAGI